MKRAILLLPVLLAACAAEPQPQAAPQPTLEEIAAQFPGVDVEGIAKCVRDNATSTELMLLAEGGQIAQTATRAILQRPATGDCIIAADVNLPPAT